MGTWQEIELSRETKFHYTRGFYIVYQENRIGIVASVNGPRFFYNDNIYRLQNNDFRFFIQHYRDRNIFYFEWNGEVIYKISYSRLLYREKGKWEDDQVHDFFAWLCNAAKKKKFYVFYTLDKPSSVIT
ncbi:hypothetical protein D3C80_1202790 [compost metagenome]